MRTKRSLALLCILFMVITILEPMQVLASQSKSQNYSRNYSITGNGAEDIVAVAQAQMGKTKAQLGYTEAWCADFVSDCARLAGQESKVPFDGYCQTLYNRIINAGGQRVYSPQKGDLVFYYCSNCSVHWCHVGIMINASQSIEGNYNGRVSLVNGSYRDGSGHSLANGIVTRRYVRPNYSVNTPKPEPQPTVKPQETTKAQWAVWMSKSKMGNETSVVPAGKPCYLCYQIIDYSTKKNWDEVHQSSYTVKQTFKRSNGSVIGSCTYTNDNNWFSLTPSEAGEYIGIVEVTGNFLGENVNAKQEYKFTVKKYYYGDVDGDGDITATDVSMANQAANNIKTLTAEQKKRADVNADGLVTKDDVTLIQQYMVGIITKFPAESHVHSYSSKVTKAATCSSTGVRTYSCACGESYTTTISKTSHTPVTDSAVAATCTRSGKTQGSHCKVCGTVITAQKTVSATGHQHTQIRNAKSATCLSEGYTGDKYCKDCGVKISAGTKISKSGHKTVTDPVVAATCTRSGKTQGSHCSVCGKVITAQKTISATGHRHTEVRNARTATTSSYGYTGDTYCKDCGAKISTGKIIEKIQSPPNTTDNGNTTGDNNNVPNENPGTNSNNNNTQNNNQTEIGDISTDTNTDPGWEKDDGTITDEPYDDETEDAEDDTLEVGDMLYDAAGTAEYEVIKVTGNTVFVSYNTTINRKQKVVTVPNQIRTEDGVICKVTAVSENAFRNNKYVKQIVLSNNVTKIGARAFSGCKKLSSVTVKSQKLTSKSLSGKAFKGISSKTQIKVPKAKKNSYKKLFCKKGLSKKVKVINM